MATILRFQPRDRQGDTRPEDVHTDARTERDGTGQETIAGSPFEQRGEIILFTGVRYCRWGEQPSDAGAEPMPAE